MLIDHHYYVVCYDVIAMETRGVNDSMELEIIERRSTPSFQDVCLSGKS